MEVNLRIGDKIFKVKKETLCQYSDYFRAMFSGYYVESEKGEINIEMLDPNTMSIIIKFMETGLIILSEYSLATISEIIVAANFLLISELNNKIMYFLDTELSESNWIEIMAIAQNTSYTQLEQYSVAYGLYTFNSMKPEYIPTIQKLVWYLAHPHLGAHNEFDVFQFGLMWLYKHQEMDAILLILACLDMKRVSNNCLMEIKELLSKYVSHLSNSSYLEIIHCLLHLTSKNVDISEASLNEHKNELLKKFSESVWSESLSIVKDTRKRQIKYIPILSLWFLKSCKPQLLPNFVYTYEEGKGLTEYLEVADKNLWGWSITAWGLTKLVVVCGEHGRGTGIFMTDVNIYDTLKKEWTHFGVQLPLRRHAGVITVGDFLYILGGVGEFRIVLDTAIVYDLRHRSWRSIAKLHDSIQNPAVCTLNDKVYVAGHKNIYCHKTHNNNDCWSMALATDRRMTFMRTYNKYIYCMQSYFRGVYRFRPGVDNVLQPITNLTNLPAAICDLGDTLIFFTRSDNDAITAEEHQGERTKPRISVIMGENLMRVNDVAGCCVLVMTMPPMCADLSNYHQQYFARHA